MSHHHTPHTRLSIRFLRIKRLPRASRCPHRPCVPLKSPPTALAIQKNRAHLMHHPPTHAQAGAAPGAGPTDAAPPPPAFLVRRRRRPKVRKTTGLDVVLWLSPLERTNLPNRLIDRPIE